jgi:glutathione peroxidase
MKHFLNFIIFCGATLMSITVGHAEPKPSDKSIYDFSLESLNGDPMPLSQFKGKVILIVNTASKCGFTPQYEGLEALQKKYQDKGLVIIGVPSNDFGDQEPGTATEIKEFCALNYGVTFPMTGKQIVSGDNAHPMYKWMYDVLGFGSAPKWNFHKYLIDTKGMPVDYFSSITKPDSSKISNAIDKLLPAL